MARFTFSYSSAPKFPTTRSSTSRYILSCDSSHGSWSWMARKATRSRSDHARSRNRGGIFGAVLKDLMTKVLRCLWWCCFNNEVVVSSLGVVPPPPLCKGGLCVVILSSSSLSGGRSFFGALSRSFERGKQRASRVFDTNDVFSLLLNDILKKSFGKRERDCEREKKWRESSLSLHLNPKHKYTHYGPFFTCVFSSPLIKTDSHTEHHSS